MTTDEQRPDEYFVIDHATDPGRCIVYAPLRSYLAAIPREAGRVLTCPKESRLKASFLTMLASKPVVDMSEILQNLHRATPELSLAITDDCNLRCIYCHASAGDPHKKRTMSLAMIRAILDAYFDRLTNQKAVSINFNGGGEPTFALDELSFAIQHATELAARRGKVVGFGMATNGCYGDRIRSFVVKHFRSVSLSLDGPEWIHNRHRPTASGGGSFEHVIETARYFVANRFPFAFRATVSAFSLNKITDLIDLIAKEFPGKSIGLEHLNPFGRAEQNLDPEVSPPNKHEFSNVIAALISYARDRNVHIMNSASTEYHLLRPVFCSNIGIPNWTVSTTGDIVACGRDNAPEVFVFGRFDEVSGQLVLDEDKISRLRSLNVLEYPECKDCFCKYHCAGDCPDRRLADKSDCASIRHIATQVLTDIVDGVQKPQLCVTDVGNRQ